MGNGHLSYDHPKCRPVEDWRTEGGPEKLTGRSQGGVYPNGRSCCGNNRCLWRVVCWIPSNFFRRQYVVIFLC